jgi:hypothetical protein
VTKPSTTCSTSTISSLSLSFFNKKNVIPFDVYLALRRHNCRWLYIIYGRIPISCTEHFISYYFIVECILLHIC